MKTYNDLVNDTLDQINELFPWDVQAELQAGATPLIVDIREPYEFDVLRIQDSLNVPRGILESACEYGYEETVPQLATGRNTDIILVCRSGNRSALAAYTMQQMGFKKVRSLKTGLKGWNDFELSLVNNENSIVSIEKADEYFTPNLKKEQQQV